jgi:hypothetical protein
MAAKLVRSCWVIILVLVFFIYPNQAFASQLVTNGDFLFGLSSWKARDLAGTSVLKLDYSGYKDAGSAQFFVKGRRANGVKVLKQTLKPAISAGGKVTLSFAWKKNWAGIMPIKQVALVKIKGPDGQVFKVWEEKSINRKNTWQLENLDISNLFKKSGKYQIFLTTQLENGNNARARVAIWFDNINLRATSSKDTSPRSTLLAPTGVSTETGKFVSLFGIATDDIGIAAVDVAILRLSDNSYWNGSSWQSTLVWNKTHITKREHSQRAFWFYSWSLPTADDEEFRLISRAIDTAKNVETRPLGSIITVDNVPPSGAIFINEAASYTNSQEVVVDVKVVGAIKMRFSTDGGISWGEWESFQDKKKVFLPPGNGMKVVLAEFKDNSGNRYQVSDSIILDQMPAVAKATYPPANASNVRVNTTISATFYEEMDGTTFKNDGTQAGSTFYLKQGSEWVEATVIYDDSSKTAKLVPKRPLNPGTVYTAYLTVGIKDAAGNSLAANYSWNFKTAGRPYISLSKTVGKEGGTISGRNQLFSLSIPKSALATDTVISISELPHDEVDLPGGLTLFSPVFEISPPGLKIEPRATVTIKYEKADIWSEQALKIYYLNRETNKWQSSRTTINFVSKTISAQVPYLTSVVAAAETDPYPPRSTILGPTGTSKFFGKFISIFGLASDNAGIQRVEVKITRDKDNRSWNGFSWSGEEVWNEALIIEGTRKVLATFLYLLPTENVKNGKLRIEVRATDIANNKQLVPSVINIDF